MILDEDARQFFRNQLGKPCVFGGPGTRQIFRGKLLRLREGVHPGGCARHFTVFKDFGVIPENCFECYKVLVTPRTVVELFKLFMIFEWLVLPLDNMRKCMTEGRDHCSGTYKGYIYCRGAEEGKEIQSIVRDVIADSISPEIPVFLRRGCSEFAAAYPQYSPAEPGAVLMEYNQDWKIHEDVVDNNSIFNTNIPDGRLDDKTTYTPAEIFAMRYWLRYAATIGDMSYLRITDCPLPPLPELKRPPFNSV